MNWRHQAACRDHDPELWFSGNPHEQAAALAACRQCPVIDECRQFADHNNRINGYPLQGIWGVARMCADCSAREQLDQQEGARA